MKGVATQTIFLIVVIGMMIFFSLVIFWNWMKNQEIEATQISCNIKKMNYCERWITKDERPNDWGSVQPSGCEQFGITEPDSKETCQAIFGQ